MHDARFVTDTLSAAYETDRIRPEQRMSTEQTFTCSSTERSNPRPTDARKLLPGDIDLVMALGDSLTAAFGADADTLATLFTEYRATSFSIGSNTGVNTLPNSLKTMNYNLTGYAIGSGPAESDQARLNVAKSGAVSADLLGQVDLLISKLSSYGYEPDLWKHITIFIGGNDLCDSCKNATLTAQNYQANIEAVLDALQAQLQNVFVSLVSPPDVTVLKDVNNKYLGGLLPLCSLIREYVCPCASDNNTSQLQAEYVNVLHNIENMTKYNTDTFYVSVQPFLEKIDLPKLSNGEVDTSYFAPDCFHWSRKAHSEAGLALWTNLMEPRGQKTTNWHTTVQFACPAAGQYLQ